MRIRIDAEQTAQFTTALVPPPIQIEAPRVAVDLNGDPMFCAGVQDTLDVEVVTGTT